MAKDVAKAAIAIVLFAFIMVVSFLAGATVEYLLIPLGPHESMASKVVLDVMVGWMAFAAIGAVVMYLQQWYESAARRANNDD